MFLAGVNKLVLSNSPVVCNVFASVLHVSRLFGVRGSLLSLTLRYLAPPLAPVCARPRTLLFLRLLTIKFLY